MKKIGIVGLGKVGMEYAYALINSDIKFEELILISKNRKKLESKVLDLNHALLSLEKNVKIKEGEYNELINANIVCITAGVPQNIVKESRDDDLDECNKIFEDIIPNIYNSGFQGIYIIASNPLDVMCRICLKYAKCNPNKIIGTGTLLDTNRLLSILGEKYNKSMFDIQGYVLGEHGPTSFVNWTSLNINVPDTEKNEINNKVRRIGLNIVDELGFTAYGVSAALLKITKCIEEDKREVLPVSTYLKDYDIFISTPSVIGKDGVYENNKGTFDETEKMEFKKSVNKIKQNIKKIQLIE